MPLRRIAVKEIMTHEVPMVGPDTPMREVVDEMARRGDNSSDSLVVVDDLRRPLGVVTERDVISGVLMEEPPRGKYLRNILSQFEMLVTRDHDSRKSRALLARELMTSPAVCVDEDASVVDATQIMEGASLRQLPVVREGVTVGLVRRAHIVKAIADVYRAGPEPAEER